MANLTTQTIAVGSGLADLEAALGAAAGGGDTAEVGSGLLFAVKNGDASSKTITVSTPGTYKGLAIPDVALVVAAGKLGLLPLSQELFQGADGRAAVTYSAVTSVTVGVFRLGS